MLASISQALLRQAFSVSRGCLHTSAPLAAYSANGLPPCNSWARRSKVIHSPEEPVTPYVCHHRAQIHYGPKKMLPVAWKVRGLSIDEAIAQLKFDIRKGARIVAEVLEEARDLAVNQHNIEFRSNLWVAESFVGRGQYLKGMRKHARGRYGIIEYRYCHYFVRLEEGPPPKHYYTPPLTPTEKLQEYMNELNNRHVVFSL